MAEHSMNVYLELTHGIEIRARRTVRQAQERITELEAQVAALQAQVESLQAELAAPDGFEWETYPDEDEPTSMYADSRDAAGYPHW